MTDEQRRVIVVGAGFAGIGCAKELAKHDDVHVTVIDKHNYQQFMPLLYQVATSQLAASDVAMDIRAEFRKHENVDVKMAEVTAVDPAARLGDPGRRAGHERRLLGARGRQQAELLRSARCGARIPALLARRR